VYLVLHLKSTKILCEKSAAIASTFLSALSIPMCYSFFDTFFCRHFYKLILLILFLGVSHVAVSQSSGCKESYFLRGYANVDSATSLLDMAAVGTNGVIAVGSYNSGPEPDGFVFRIDKEGQKLWELNLAGSGSQTCRNIIQLQDHNYMVGGYDFSQAAPYFLLKLDSSGTILWRKNFTNAPIIEIAEAADGSLLLAAVNTSSGRGMQISRLTSTGDPIYSYYYGISGDFLPSQLRDILIKDGFLYVAGARFYSPGGGGMYHGVLSKVEIATGNLLWTKVYNFNAGPQVFMQLFDYGDNNLCILGQNEVNASDLNNIAIADTAGIIQSVRSFTFGNYRQFGFAAMDKDKNIIYANRNLGVGNANLVLVSVHPLTGINWAKTYPFIISPLIEKVIINSIQEIYLGGRLAPRREQLFISKHSSDGGIGCSPLPLSVNDGTGMFHSLNIFLPRVPVQNSSIAGAPLPAGASFSQSAPSCVTTNLCDALSISISNTICKRGDTLIVNLLKNKECLSIPQWSFDTSTFTLIDYTNEMARFKVKQEGSTIITAKIIVSCDTLADSKEVHVRFSPDSIDLGDNTTLCPSNTKLLHAGSGFQNYLWQDGSTAPTYLVTKPGTYFVEAYNYCGSVFKDTIVIKGAPPIDFNLGAEKFKCNADSVTLTAPPGFLNYNWSPAYQINTTIGQVVKVNPAIDTVYKVVAEKTPGCFAYGTVRINVHHSPPINLGADKSFCLGDIATFDAGGGFRSYAWSTGDTLARIHVTRPGRYIVQGTTSEGCLSRDTVLVTEVFPLPKIPLDKDTTLCAGSSRTLNAGTFAAYAWNTGSITRSIQVNTPGWYSVRVIDDRGCRNADSVHISKVNFPPSGFLPADTMLCLYSKLELRPIRDFKSYTWSNSSTQRQISVDKAGTYWLEVMDENRCIGKDSIIIKPMPDCMKGLYVPSAFTPNNDGKNDVFRVMLFGAVKTFKLQLYNRWGELVFQTADPHQGWDGRFRSKVQGNEVFVWTCSYQLEGADLKMEKGTVTLIR